MMKAQMIFIGALVLIAVVSAIVQMIRSQREASGKEAARSGGNAPRTSQNEMDRFFEEIERLRKKSAETKSAPPPPPPPIVPVKANKPNKGQKASPLKALPVVPVVKKSKPRRAEEPIPVVVPVARAARPAPPVMILPDAYDMPPTMAAAAAKRTSSSVNSTSFQKLLADRDSAVLAIMLTQVLGPPRSQKPHTGPPISTPQSPPTAQS
ncbi:MAG: hypothetical protein ACRCZF_27695 [Gemmataceae bacterium]